MTFRVAPPAWHLELAIDTAHHRLFSVCQNNIMAVTNSENGKPVASVLIGEGPDTARFDAKRGLVFSSNGRGGTLTVVREETPDHYQVIANVPRSRAARRASSGSWPWQRTLRFRE
ncbi:MAG: hypothetical protein ACRD22_14850 [Terriglobia bacterium]